MSITAVALFSGGLDSSIAVCLLQAQGIEVIGFHHTSAFGHSTLDGAPTRQVLQAAEELQIHLHTEDATDAMLQMVRAPRYGLGRHLNPCIDCRIHKIQAAEAYRRTIGAEFLTSGEVLGQRPMSQNRQALQRIDAATGVADRLLRPLSARRLAETLPERAGWVRRARLPGIAGRRRTAQLRIAERLGIHHYAPPAGGCLLTEAGFSRKLADLLTSEAPLESSDLYLLRLGRHFRLSPETRVIVGRDEEENRWIEHHARTGDQLLWTAERPGATVLVRSALPCADPDAIDHLHTAAGLAVHYSRFRDAAGADVDCSQVQPPPASPERLRGIQATDPATLQNLAEPAAGT